MPQVDLSAGTIEYGDTGGDGPAIVMVHGLVMDGTLWRKVMMRWAESQRDFDRPVLVAWAAEDRVMPREHGPRLAALFPDARLVEIPDSYTLVPEDQPGPLAQAIREFVAGSGGVRG
jgi:pimeloyl-ACP methyl ester carboxylesterase